MALECGWTVGVLLGVVDVQWQLVAGQLQNMVL